MAEQTLETFLPYMPTYNMMDMFHFIFKDSAGPNSGVLYPLDFVMAEYEDLASGKLYAKLSRRQAISKDEYVRIGLYSPSRRRDADDMVVPKSLMPVLRLVMNAANNMVILSRLSEYIGEGLSQQREYDTNTLGHMLEQTVRFIMYACGAAWDLDRMNGSFVPYDVYQFLDIYQKFGVFDREVVIQAGAEYCYNIEWHASLGM